MRGFAGAEDPLVAAIPEGVSPTPLSWICTRPGLPYFVDEHGESWTPVGQNDAITWPELEGLFRRRDLAGVERHLRWLKAHGVTCLRLMLEYVQGEHRYLERPVGRFPPNMVRLWDDMFMLLEKVGLRVLLTPFDTFFLWLRWKHHPYRRANGGPCSDRQELLRCPDTREAIKRRLAFASDRWGGSPALFAWDLWNEINPAVGGDDIGTLSAFVADVGPWLRERETARHGRAHPQTVSVFWKDYLDHPGLGDIIFRHPSLDFTSVHLYEFGTLDDPADTVAPAVAVGRLMRHAAGEITDDRPLLDSEHGPIHNFLDKRKTLSEPFDDEYFRHIQWAHLASGGAGGGMRWPNRHPHVLTSGMRLAQRSLAAFLPLIAWTEFRRRNLSDELRLSESDVAAFACGDNAQAVVWLLRSDDPAANEGLRPERPPRPVRLAVPGLGAGRYRLMFFDTRKGRATGLASASTDGGGWLSAEVPLANDLAIAVRRESLA